MEQSNQPSGTVMGVVTSAAQTAYNAPNQSAAQTAYNAPNQSAAMISEAPAVFGGISPGIPMTSTFAINPQQHSYQQSQPLHQHQQLYPHQPLHHHPQNHQLRDFWAAQMASIEQNDDFKSHCLPLSRIKKVMKADKDVKMISAETPVIFAKACEMFILELTLRSWNHAEQNKRRTLQKNDVAAAVAQTDIFDFLVDIRPRGEPNGEGSRIASASALAAATGAQANPMPYYYGPPQQEAEMIMGDPTDPTSTAAMESVLAYMWHQPQEQQLFPDAN